MIIAEILAWLMISIMFIGMLYTVSTVGKPRRASTPSEVAAAVCIYVLEMGALVYIVIALRHGGYE